jgi:phage gpG-like protein
MGSVDGLDKVLSNLDKKEAAICRGVADGMAYGLSDTVTHIKDNYVWRKHGKGFDDRTGNLRNSITYKVENQSLFLGKGEVYGWVYATMEYAPYVELRWEGRRAYLYPGVLDKEKDIFKSIADMVKTAINIF